mmetsp:Transcript_22793/g.71449  ORF Transcript_22793/g.71449 Transcript_22793/m.71449 type:complete len:326 (+) Transcript_22793:256-1233(+)
MAPRGGRQRLQGGRGARPGPDGVPLRRGLRRGGGHARGLRGRLPRARGRRAPGRQRHRLRVRPDVERQDVYHAGRRHVRRVGARAHAPRGGAPLRGDRGAAGHGLPAAVLVPRGVQRAAPRPARGGRHGRRADPRAPDDGRLRRGRGRGRRDGARRHGRRARARRAEPRGRRDRDERAVVAVAHGVPHRRRVAAPRVRRGRGRPRRRAEPRRPRGERVGPAHGRGGPARQGGRQDQHEFADAVARRPAARRAGRGQGPRQLPRLEAHAPVTADALGQGADRHVVLHRAERRLRRGDAVDAPVRLARVQGDAQARRPRGARRRVAA